MTPVIPAPEPKEVKHRRSHPNARCYTAFDLVLFFAASETTIYRWAENGTIPSEKVGGKVIFPKLKLDPFLRSKGIIE